MRLGSLSHVQKPENNKNATGAAIRCSRSASRPSLHKRLVRGSLTAEAALALPVCLGVLLILGCLIRALQIYEAVDVSLCSAARRTAAYSSSKGGVKKSRAALFFYEEMKSSHTDTSLIRGGLAGIRIRLLEDGTSNGIIQLQASYRMKFPGLVLGRKMLLVRNCVCARAYSGTPHTGKDGIRASGNGETERNTLIVAENGIVYHTDEDCSYLDLSIQSVPAKGIRSRRNIYGSRYVPCEKCVHGKTSGNVYITRQGEAWHLDRNCSGLKRSLHLLTPDEADGSGLRPCPRCGH